MIVVVNSMEESSGDEIMESVHYGESTFIDLECEISVIIDEIIAMVEVRNEECIYQITLQNQNYFPESNDDNDDIINSNNFQAETPKSKDLNNNLEENNRLDSSNNHVLSEKNEENVEMDDVFDSNYIGTETQHLSRKSFNFRNFIKSSSLSLFPQRENRSEISRLNSNLINQKSRERDGKKQFISSSSVAVVDNLAIKSIYKKPIINLKEIFARKSTSPSTKKTSQQGDQKTKHSPISTISDCDKVHPKRMVARRLSATAEALIDLALKGTNRSPDVSRLGSPIKNEKVSEDLVCTEINEEIDDDDTSEKHFGNSNEKETSSKNTIKSLQNSNPTSNSSRVDIGLMKQIKKQLVLHSIYGNKDLSYKKPNKQLTKRQVCN
jgi:hypothetical protein